MNKSVPAPAALLLDFISGPESGGGYDVIYGNHQGGLLTPITTWSINSLMANQAVWGSKWGSSAAGRYQFMPTTLRGLLPELGLTGAETFTPDLQDRLGYQLLIRRGYAQFVAGKLSTVAFAEAIAKEWASFPVLEPTQGAHRMLERGQSYYAGDGLNKAGVSSEKVEAILARVLAPAQPFPALPRPTPIPPIKTPPTVHPAVPTTIGGAVILGGAAAVSAGIPWPWIAAVVAAVALAVGVYFFIRNRK